jgi:putative transposase
MRRAYSTDLSDTQWERLRSVIAPAKNGRTGRPRTYALRESVNALLYQARTGC